MRGVRVVLGGGLIEPECLGIEEGVEAVVGGGIEWIQRRNASTRMMEQSRPTSQSRFRVRAMPSHDPADNSCAYCRRWAAISIATHPTLLETPIYVHIRAVDGKARETRALEGEYDPVNVQIH